VKSVPRRRTYAGAATGRLLSSFFTTNTTANDEARASLRALRARSRQLARDDDYAKRFLSLIQINVIGAQGVLMQNKATLPNDPQRFDDRTNDLIESAWARWAERLDACITGRASWVDMQELYVRTLARDGETFVKKVYNADNPSRFALQFIEADLFDDMYNKVLENGNVIDMAVERDPYGRPVRYHMSTADALLPYPTLAASRIAIPASEMLHGYIEDRPGQARGIPWLHSAMVRLHHLHKYEESELVAARVAAAKMGFFTTPSGEEYIGDDRDDEGNKIVEAEPGTFEELPAGQEFTPWDPTHPGDTYEPFTKQQLRGAAAGMGVSYASLSGDLTDVNYSSIRAGSLETRDVYRSFQKFMIRHFCQPVFDAWLMGEIMANRLPFGIADIPRISRADWMVRGWEWVDPLKDTTASIQALQHGLTTRTRELAKQGQDFEDTLKELQRERLLAEQYGVKFPAVGSSNDDAATKSKSKADDAEDEDVDEGDEE
jgi:lambda family phage portal protein